MISMKKVMSLLLAAVLVLSIAPCTFAAGSPTSGPISVVSDTDPSSAESVDGIIVGNRDDLKLGTTLTLPDGTYGLMARSGSGEPIFTIAHFGTDAENHYLTSVGPYYYRDSDGSLKKLTVDIGSYLSVRDLTKTIMIADGHTDIGNLKLHKLKKLKSLDFKSGKLNTIALEAALKGMSKKRISKITITVSKDAYRTSKQKTALIKKLQKLGFTRKKIHFV